MDWSVEEYLTGKIRGEHKKQYDKVEKKGKKNYFSHIKPRNIYRPYYLQRRSVFYSALDLGTNNCRLLIAEPSPTGFKVVDAFSRVVRLGEKVSQTRRLSEEAIERTLEALEECRAKMSAQHVKRMRLVATEACRSAENGIDFLKKVKREIGLNLEIISRKTEVRLAAAGCASLVDPQARSIIVFDIGGGSTEIAWLKGQIGSKESDPCQYIRAWDSIPLGVVLLAEKYSKKPDKSNIFEEMIEEVTFRLRKFSSYAKRAIDGSHSHLLGASGTVTTIGGIFLELPRYNRNRVDGMWMTNNEVQKVVGKVSKMSLEERIAHCCIGEERAELVIAGCAILEAIRRLFPCDRLRIADRGLREGILMGMMRTDDAWKNLKNYNHHQN